MMRRQSLSGRRLCDHCKERATVKLSAQVGRKVECAYGCPEHERDAKTALQKKIKRAG